VPDDTAWSLSERPGFLRLHTLPPRIFGNARNSLTQRAIGPYSTLRPARTPRSEKGDVAGLALLNLPYACDRGRTRSCGLKIGPVRSADGRTGVVRTQSDTHTGCRDDSDFLKEKSALQLLDERQEVHPLGRRIHQRLPTHHFQGVGTPCRLQPSMVHRAALRTSTP